MYLAGKDAALYLMEGKSFIEELMTNQERVNLGLVRTIAPPEMNVDAKRVHTEHGDYCIIPSDMQVSSMLESLGSNGDYYNFFKSSFSCYRVVAGLDDYFSDMYQSMYAEGWRDYVNEWEIMTKEDIRRFESTPSVSLDLKPTIADIEKISYWLYSGIVRCDDVEKAANNVLGSVLLKEVNIMDECRVNKRAVFTPRLAKWHNLGVILRRVFDENGVFSIDSGCKAWGLCSWEKLELWEMSEEQPLDFSILPKELQTEAAKNYIVEAFKKGLLKFTDGHFVWTKTTQLLACFAREMSIELKMGKGDRISWKPFEETFGLKKGCLRLSFNDIQKTGQNPYGVELINECFK